MSLEPHKPESLLLNELLVLKHIDRQLPKSVFILVQDCSEISSDIGGKCLSSSKWLAVTLSRDFGA